MTPAGTFGRGRRLAILLNVLVMVALGLTAAVIATWLTGFTELRRRFDLTATGRYTLSPESLDLIGALEEPVRIVTVFDRVTWPWDVDLVRPKAREYTQDLLQEYRVRSRGLIAVEDLDPAADNARVRDLFATIGLGAYDVVIVESGDQRRVLTLDQDLAEFDPGAPPPLQRPARLKALVAEEAISSAIYEVTQGEPARVYVTTGHGEPSIHAGGDFGASILAASLRRDNVRVDPLNLFSAKTVPLDADALLVLAPMQPFLDEERTALADYLRRGGRLLVALDPLGDASLAPLLEEVGVGLERVIVAFEQGGVLKGEQVQELFVGARSPGSFGTHAVTAPLIRDQDVVVTFRSLALVALDPTLQGFASLLLSHPDAFGDELRGERAPGDYVFDPRVEKRGQRILAAAVEPPAYAGTRLVVLGSATLFQNAALQRVAGNGELLRRMVAWLVGKEQRLHLPPRAAQPNVADLRPSEFDALFAYTALYMPAGALLLALVVWWLRRR